MLQVPGPDECPKCGEKIDDCICSLLGLAADNRNTPSVKRVSRPLGLSSGWLPTFHIFPVRTETTPGTLTVFEPDVSPTKGLSTSTITVIEPRVGHPQRQRYASIRERDDWEEIEDPERYTLPPVDRNLYDVQSSQTSRDKLVEPQVPRSKSESPVFRRKPRKPKEVIVTESEPKQIPYETQDTPDEDLYRRRGCWCKDCPWLIAYIIFALLWLILLGIMWHRKGSFWGGTHISIKDSRCVLLCSELVAPSRSLDVERASPTTFHCSKNVEKWERDIFHPWNKEVDREGNPNCLQDCRNFKPTEAFISACVKPERAVEGREWSTISQPGSALVYEDSIRGHWHWIVHVILITNAISLFILLVPLFFCCPMVAVFVVASVAASLTLTIMLWWDMGRYLERRNNQQPNDASIYFKWTFAIASTMFSAYVIFNAFLTFKRFRITCAIAGMASRVVNAVRMILLEAILTMILLFLLIVLIVFVSLGIESRAPLYATGSTYHFYSSPLTWIARGYTIIFAYWTAQMIINCQTIIIHGAMARYYFEKNMKNKVLISHKRLLMYHICTACFAGLLFNWLYWIRWFDKKTRIRSRSLFGTGAIGLCFCPASKHVRTLVFMDPNILRRIDKANPYFFLVHVLVVLSIAIVCRLVFSNLKKRTDTVWNGILKILNQRLGQASQGPYSAALWPEFIMVFYAYFVSLSVTNIYRVTKDAMFLAYEEDKTLSREHPARSMKMPYPVSVFFGYEPRVSPR